MPDLSRLDASTLVLAGMLGAMLAITLVASVVASERRRRREAASLNAIDFVRSSFASRLARGVPMDELLLEIVEALHDTFKLDSSELWLDSAGILRLHASEPGRAARPIPVSPSEESIAANARISGSAWLKVWLPALLDSRQAGSLRVAPISVSGRLLGIIVVQRAKRGERLAEEADVTLEELAREVGVGLNKQRMDAALQDSLEQLRQQALDLQASRSRIVVAADEERRRIERNLHDGAQQYLVAVAVKARLIQQLAARDPGRTAKLIDELAADVGVALEELRSLAHGIYPPLLNTGGLCEAVAAACNRGPMYAEFKASNVGRYPPELEAAVYFCCVEALQNAAKYAGDGATATVRIWEEAGGLLFEIADDGVGFDVARQGGGAGVVNMGDRIGAVGGTLRIESEPHKGTRVVGAVPVTETSSATSAM